MQGGGGVLENGNAMLCGAMYFGAIGRQVGRLLYGWMGLEVLMTSALFSWLMSAGRGRGVVGGGRGMGRRGIEECYCYFTWKGGRS